MSAELIAYLMGLGGMCGYCVMDGLVGVCILMLREKMASKHSGVIII